MSRVTHFHISGNAPAALIGFYRDIFGWEFEKAQSPRPTWHIKTGDGRAAGIDGLLHTRETDSRLVNTIEVDDIDDIVSRIESYGGTIIQLLEIPEAGKLALFEDPEQNRMH